MEGDSFYVTLPSDASLISYPSNHGGSYTVQLPTSLQINSHEWECGLAEIIFNQDYPGLIKSDIWISACINDREGGEWSKCSQDTLTDLEVTKVYDNVEDFLSTALKPLLLRVIKNADLTGGETLFFKTYKDHFSFTIPRLTHSSKMPIRLEFSSTLLQILGFTRSQLKDKKYFQTDQRGRLQSPTSHFESKLSRAISSLWVYTDIIRGHITGHSISPLLRVIPIDSSLKNDTSRVLQFEKPYFFPVNVDTIEQISIHIYNANGNEVLVFATPIVCKIHFRKRR